MWTKLHTHFADDICIYRRNSVGPYANAVLLIQNCNSRVCSAYSKLQQQSQTQQANKYSPADKDGRMAYLLHQESASFVSALHKQGAQHLHQPFQAIPQGPFGSAQGALIRGPHLRRSSQRVRAGFFVASVAPCCCTNINAQQPQMLHCLT